jgi:hypothetical protein
MKTDDEAATEMKSLSRSGQDSEGVHKDADLSLCELLISLGYEKTVAEFMALEKWYS